MPEQLFPVSDYTLSTAAVCEVLGTTRQQVDRWVSNGRYGRVLEFHQSRMNGRRWFRPTDIVEWGKFVGRPIVAERIPVDLRAQFGYSANTDNRDEGDERDDDD